MTATVKIETYAEDLPCWKTGASSPDTWLEKAKREIDRAGGEVLAELFGNQDSLAAFVIRFTLEGDTFNIIWPVAQPKKEGEESAAKRQAATLLYHDIKARCVSARIRGARTAFFADLVLPGGRVASEVSAPELMQRVPKMLTAPEERE